MRINLSVTAELLEVIHIGNQLCAESEDVI